MKYNKLSMKKLIFYSLMIIILAGCKSSGEGELIGARKNSSSFYQPTPYGMVFIPQGSFVMGSGDEDIARTNLYQPKNVSVSAFYMDQTEITNNEYRQFVNWVRDSIARYLLGQVKPEDYLIEEDPVTGEVYDPPYLNWKTPINWNSEDQDVRDALSEMYIPENERYFRKKEIDARKLMYTYSWIDFHEAAKKDMSQKGDYVNASFSNRPQGLKDRSVYVYNETINVYPDTLCWIADFSYSFNDPLTEKYFWHPAYDNYPVVGVNWRQARAFCVWRTNYYNKKSGKGGNTILSEFRLPTEAEWEWAARGGHQLTTYPWGGPYTVNDKGCFLANFKPRRGDYVADGGLRTMVVGHYPSNDFDLYDMAGNVSEWTLSAYDPVSYNFTWDMNPNYTYNAKEDDPPVLKRKVIRGGSWKDIKYYLQVFVRDYEYQDTAKSYIGFRCIQPYAGSGDGNTKSSGSRVY